MQSQVKYAKRLNAGETLVRREPHGQQLIQVEKIQNARGRKPRRGGSTLLVHTPVGILRLNTKDPVRVLVGLDTSA